ncbi:MAG TPA: Xaa-Pro peptidase family protein [Chthoniobacteraceae bacterium]|nr:Xaa-Pro peptidase family protein [Chthoniobacteraceae bacterium]
MPRSQPRLIVADSEHSPDMLYATRFFAPDPFIFLEKNGRRSIVLNDLEIDRGRKTADVDTVVAWSQIARKLGLPKGRQPRFAEVVARFLKMKKVRKALVPASFPLGLANELAKAGVHLAPQAGLFWREREFKSAEELRLMRRAVEITECGMARAIEVLKASRIGAKKQLYWSGRALTSEILRAEIDSAVLRAGGLPANTIVAGGIQACDPHERGSGPLHAHSLIILDIFPRDAKSGYYGDLTRTVVRGRASGEQRRLWETVLEGQSRALKAMKPGADGKTIHESVKEFFKQSGYPTERKKGRWTGFFHGTGHGLGLEIHEEPRFAATVFKPGQVITVEPGLYYPHIGGVRIEDDATITAKGVKLLSGFPKQLEI